MRQLNRAIQTRGFKLFVEHLSSSYSLLEVKLFNFLKYIPNFIALVILKNGTGIYGVLWEAMTTKQETYLVNSVEEGVLMVKDQKNMALMAGRETLFFDIQRFGTSNSIKSKFKYKVYRYLRSWKFSFKRKT